VNEDGGAVGSEPHIDLMERDVRSYATEPQKRTVNVAYGSSALVTLKDRFRDANSARRCLDWDPPLGDMLL
jgi:hypothetical protein